MGVNHSSLSRLASPPCSFCSVQCHARHILLCCCHETPQAIGCPFGTNFLVALQSLPRNLSPTLSTAVRKQTKTICATRCVNKQQVTLPPVHWNWPWIWEHRWCLAALAEQEGHGYQIARGDRNAKLPYLQDKSLLFIVRNATALRTMMTLHSMSNDKQIKKDQTVKR